MLSKDSDVSPPERDRTANRRWMIGIVLSLVFGIFGAVMALLSYMDRDEGKTIYRSSPTGKPSAPAAESPPAPGPSADPAPDDEDKGKGNDKK